MITTPQHIRCEGCLSQTSQPKREGKREKGKSKNPSGGMLCSVEGKKSHLVQSDGRPVQEKEKWKNPLQRGQSSRPPGKEPVRGKSAFKRTSTPKAAPRKRLGKNDKKSLTGPEVPKDSSKKVMTPIPKESRKSPVRQTAPKSSVKINQKE